MDEQDKMDELRTRIAELAEEAKVICLNHGLTTMDGITIIVRDTTNPNMYFVVSNDSGCSYTFWRKPEDFMPDEHKWILANVRPSRHGNVQDPDYLVFAAYDNDTKTWRTPLGSLHGGYRVLNYGGAKTPANYASTPTKTATQ